MAQSCRRLARAASNGLPMKPRYPLNIHFDGKQYVAVVPDLANCSGTGSSYAEAATNAEEAIRQWVADAISAGLSIPAPAFQQRRVKKSDHRNVESCVIPSVVSAQSTIDALITDTYEFRRKHHRNQLGFWLRFGVRQSTASRYERLVGGVRRQLPIHLAMLVSLWVLRRIDDRSLAEVYALLRPYYTKLPTLHFDEPCGQAADN